MVSMFIIDCINIEPLMRDAVLHASVEQLHPMPSPLEVLISLHELIRDPKILVNVVPPVESPHPLTDPLLPFVFQQNVAPAGQSVKDENELTVFV